MSSHSVTVDSSAIIAVITKESLRKKLVQLTKGKSLIAPKVLDYEIGNAFSAMFKRKSLSLKDAKRAYQIYRKIPIRFVDSDVEASMEIAHDLNLYAYDCYFLETARKFKTAIVSIDNRLLFAAKHLNIPILE